MAQRPIRSFGWDGEPRLRPHTRRRSGVGDREPRRAAGHQVKLSNSRGSGRWRSSGRLVANASAVAEAAQADLMILAVGWDQVPETAQELPEWNGRILIDATSQ